MKSPHKKNGYGITPDGVIVDINDPNFQLQEFASVVIQDQMSIEEFKKIYPDIKLK